MVAVRSHAQVPVFEHVVPRSGRRLVPGSPHVMRAQGASRVDLHLLLAAQAGAHARKGRASVGVSMPDATASEALISSGTAVLYFVASPAARS
jgi:hypothetical protein